MKNIKKFILFGCLVFSLWTVPAKAQGPVYKPGDLIHVSVKFAGPDAEKISAVSIGLKRQNPTSNPSPFQEQFDARNSKKTGPDTFEVSFLVTKSVASGEYTITYISATVDLGNGAVGFDYRPGEFPPKTFKIDNSTKVEKPTIKDVT